MPYPAGNPKPIGPAMPEDFKAFFSTAFTDKRKPYVYQQRLACGEQQQGQSESDWLRSSGPCESRLINVPTGFGKTNPARSSLRRSIEFLTRALQAGEWLWNAAVSASPLPLLQRGHPRWSATPALSVFWEIQVFPQTPFPLKE